MYGSSMPGGALIVLFVAVVVVGTIAALVQDRRHRAKGLGPMNPAGLRPTNWRYRTDQRGNLHVTITDYGLTQRRSRSYTFAPGTPDSAIPMEALQAVRKARRAGWR